MKKLMILAALSLFVFAQAPAVFAASCDTKYSRWLNTLEQGQSGRGEACVRKSNAMCQSTSMISICRTCTGSGSITACTNESDDLRSDDGNCCTSYPVGFGQFQQRTEPLCNEETCAADMCQDDWSCDFYK